jgi:hypothetical protein
MSEVGIPSREQYAALKAHARAVAKKEIDLFVASAKALSSATRRHDEFIKDLECTCDGYDIVGLLAKGPASVKWSRLLRERNNAADRNVAAEQDARRALETVIAKFGLPTQIEYNGQVLRERASMTWEERNNTLPEGAKMINEILQETLEESRGGTTTDLSKRVVDYQRSSNQPGR